MAGIDINFFYVFFALLTIAATVRLIMPLVSRRSISRDEVMAHYMHEEPYEATRGDYILAAIFLVAVPIAALSIYLPLGKPSLEGAPYVFRMYRNEVPIVDTTRLNMLSTRPLEVLIKQNPDNIDALMSLGGLNMVMGRYDAAVKLYKHAVDVSKENMLHRVIITILGEAQVEANNGIVGEDAIKSFHRVLEIHPTNPVARYHLALAKAQAGKKAEALEEWQQLMDESHPNAPWMIKVRKQMGQTRRKIQEK